MLDCFMSIIKKTFSELQEQLRMPHYYNYHTGIRKDENNLKKWIRSSDKAEIEIKDWPSGFPSSYDGYDFLMLYFHDKSNENSVYNEPDLSYYFICEY